MALPQLASAAQKLWSQPLYLSLFTEYRHASVSLNKSKIPFHIMTKPQYKEYKEQE